MKVRISNYDKLISNFIKKSEIADEKSLQKKDTELIIFGESSDRIMYTLANCCKPIPGDDVFGFITINEGIKIHRNNCANAEHLMSKMAYRLVKARWKDEELKERLAAIKLFGTDELYMTFFKGLEDLFR